MIETMTLLPGVVLRCYRDNRFKQGCLSIQLVRPMRGEEAAMNALIPNVLLRGTVRHPDLRSVTMALDDLYGASVSPMVRRIGDYQSMGLYCSFMDQRFALPGDRVLEPMVDFLKELLLESPVENGGFDPEFVESEKKNLISTIESELNDKRIYSMNRLMRIMCREDTFGLPRMGDRSQVEAIDPVGLYRHYRTMLRESRVLVFYVGSADAETVAPLVRSLFAELPREPMELPAQSDFHSCPGREETEVLDVAQGKLCMGFTTPITNRRNEFAAMQMLNVVFGGGMTSKLFQNVREKQSLCYSIGSSYYGTKGILTVYAGIDFEKEQVTRSEILHQLELCCRGEISDEEMTAAREALVSGLRSTHDSPGAIEGFYVSSTLSGLKMDPGAYMEAILAVTKEQVAEAARSLQLHSTYFLKGGAIHD